MFKYILQLIMWVSPFILFIMAISITLILVLLDVKYTFEPNLTSEKVYFLLSEIYNIIYALYWVSVISFIAIMTGVALFSIRKINKLKSIVADLRAKSKN
jgi:hypothetical protein